MAGGYGAPGRGYYNPNGEDPSANVGLAPVAAPNATQNTAGVVQQPGWANPMPQSQFTAAAPATSANLDAGRAQQEAFLAALQQQMQGGGPDVAGQRLREETNANQAMTAGTIASARGINPGTAARLAAEAGARIQQQAVGQAGLQRAEQQLGTEGLVGQQLQGLRQGDISTQQVVGGQNLAAQGLNQQTAGQNLQAYLQQEQLNQQKDVTGKDVLGPLSSAAGIGLSALLLARGGPVPRMDYRDGGGVPGRAKMPGDHTENDTVPAKLSPGEGVIPRSIMQADDAPAKAADFVAAIKKKKDAGQGPGRHLARLKQLEKRVASLEGGR